MSFFGIPQNKRGSQRVVRSSDIEVIDLLKEILEELKKSNIHMELINDEEVKSC